MKSPGLDATAGPSRLSLPGACVCAGPELISRWGLRLRAEGVGGVGRITWSRLARGGVGLVFERQRKPADAAGAYTHYADGSAMPMGPASYARERG